MTAYGDVPEWLNGPVLKTVRAEMSVAELNVNPGICALVLAWPNQTAPISETYVKLRQRDD